MAGPILDTRPTIHSGEKAIKERVDAAKGNSRTNLAISVHSRQISTCKRHKFLTLFVVKGFQVQVLSLNLNYILKSQGCGFQLCFTGLLSLLLSELHPSHVLSQCGVLHLSLPVTTHSKPFPGTEYFTMHSAHCRRSPASLLHCTLHTAVHVAAHNIPRYPILHTLHLKAHNVQLIRSCSVARTAEQSCSISARSKPFPRLRR